MEASVDKNLKRRREQNRLAQRRFRERHSGENKAAVYHCFAPPHGNESTAASEYMSLDFYPSTDDLDVVFDTTLFSSPEITNLDAHPTNFGPDFSETLVVSTPPTQETSSKEVGTGKGLPSPTTCLQQPPSAPAAETGSSGEEGGGGVSDTETATRPSASPGWLSPLHIAAHKGHDSIVRLLVQHHPDCNEKDSDSTTPLMLAVVGGYEDVVSTLLSHGARVAERDTQGRSSLHWAVVYRREDLLRLLLDNCQGLSAAVNAYNAFGRTPLHTAIAIGFEAGVQVLLRYGANVCLKARKMPV